MLDKTQILADPMQPQSSDKKEEAQPETTLNKKKTPSKVGAIGAGIAVGVGAISWDVYGEEIGKEIDESTNSTADLTTQEEESETSTNTTSGQTTPAETHPPSPETHQHTETPHDNVHVTAVPDHLAIANMPDSMSFSEAFGAARQLMGAGALFEWRGELYHTCHPNEYATLPQEIKHLFADVWIANESHIDGIELVPEQEGVMYVHNLNTHPQETHTPTNGSEEMTDNSDGTPSDDYTAYTDVSPVEDDYDNDYEGAEDFINPDDLVA